MGKEWTKERREAAAARCRANKPWENSSGPKTAKGKMRSSLNAIKHGERSVSCANALEMIRLNRQFYARFKAFLEIDTLKMDLTDELINNYREKAAHALKINNCERGGTHPATQKHDQTDNMGNIL